MDTLLRGLRPIASPAARVLVLGSMPSAASLAARQYYAHPRNAFWDVMDALVGAGRELAYAKRVRRLRAAGIAVWDVIGACRRRGSLDSAIEPESICVNDVAGLLKRCRRIRAVATNGGMAATLYGRHLAPAIDLRWIRLPSTSPANASWSIERKIEAWRVIEDVI